MESFIEDCDFADDIALLLHTKTDKQSRPDASIIGLKVHPSKNEVIKVY